MPRFFFNLTDGIECRDEEGSELPDAATACERAIEEARCIMAEEVRHGKLPLRDVIDVVDASGKQVATVPFRDAIEIEE